MTEKAQFRWYIGGVCSWYAALGIQLVLFPWLVAVELGAPADMVGIAQMSIMLPTLLFVLIGGVTADRVDGRKLLIIMHFLSALPPLALAAIILAGHFSYAMMIAYALWMGLNSAFMNPARDAMLNNVAGGNIQRAVTMTTGMQFGIQLLGFAAASVADTTGAVPILLLQAGVVLIGAFTAMRLPSKAAAEVDHAAPRQSGLAGIAEGLSAVFRSRRLFPVVILNFAMGVLYLGAFFVLIPLLIRDIHLGDSSELALANIDFTVGTILSTILMIRRGGVRRPGRAFMLALLVGGLALTAIAFGLPFWMNHLMVFFWGLCGGVAMAMGRTIVQEDAPASHRARVLSIYQLVVFGGSPLGALGMGYLVGSVGPLNAFFLPGNAMAVIVVVMFAISDLGHGRRPRDG